jgi:hypothetical protein
MGVTNVVKVWRVLIVAAGVTGLVLGWGPASDPTGPLVYFTIQSNIMIAGYLTFVLFCPASVGGRLGAARRSTVARGAVTLYIAITGLVYHFVLAAGASPLHLLTGPGNHVQGLSTFLLHYTVPPLAVADFLVVDRSGAYRARHALIWLCYPFAYLAYALIRGAFFTVGSYPYPFVNVTVHGYAGVALNVVIYSVLFYLLGMGLVGLGRLVRSRARAAEMTAPSVAPARVE